MLCQPSESISQRPQSLAESGARQPNCERGQEHQFPLNGYRNGINKTGGFIQEEANGFGKVHCLLGNPFQQTDSPHLAPLAMRENISASLYFPPVLAVVLI